MKVTFKHTRPTRAIEETIDTKVAAQMAFIYGADWQKEKNIKTFKNVYADLLSAQGYDVGSINSEINRLERIIKEGE